MRGVIGDRYVIGEVIGAGGMGIVYAANQRSLDRTVAVKLPRPELAADPAVRQRFRTEARAGSRVNHRNVVRVLDYGDDDGTPYLVMEHVVGAGLGQVIDEHGAMPIATAVRLVDQILAGLDDAHAKGIVHADVKCDNILVETLRDGSLRARIIDFGISRFVEDPCDDGSAPIVSGTPEYLAPELIRGGSPTVASDIYAVGVILYDLISGATPFAGGSSEDVMSRQLDAEPVPLSWRCPTGGIPPVLDEVVARALAKQPCDRFADAAAFRRALAAIPRPPAAELPRLADGTGSTMFAMEATTATICTDVACPRLAESSGDGARLEQCRRGAAEAVARGDADVIVVAYLDLARAHIDDHQLAAAAEALEQGVALLARSPKGPSWRLLLTLAALYDGRGDRARARRTTRLAREQAVLCGSALGRRRADELLARLARTRRTTRPPPW